MRPLIMPSKIDPYKNSAFSTKNKIYRQLWSITYITVFRPTPKFLFKWRNFILKIFGARIGQDTCIHQTAKIWCPANLVCEDMVAIAEHAEIYNPSKITLKSHAIISQGAYLCGASHYHDDINFELFSKEILIGDYAWVCAKSTVLLGTKVGNGAVLATGSIATKDLLPWTIYAGIPAKPIKKRNSNGRK